MHTESNAHHRRSQVQCPCTPSARNPSAKLGLALTYCFAPSSVYVEDDSDWGRTTVVGSIPASQLQEIVRVALRRQVEAYSSSLVTYERPYTWRIELMRMPANYQSPKLQQPDGRGNPRQHVADFVKTCNNAGTEGDMPVKQFVRSLKGSAFDWYTDL
ncbi:hypothetical protein CRG98_014351 [Punica granatum]|uniref:Retrotransposon gag domain-containing protein n=1 Tax=Punica granatum TaxID=22663 RepID=A0A2I0K9H4_PUNGR|nr:hypothetical protein CRG98_014351 [Punica granatum]